MTVVARDNHDGLPKPGDWTLRPSLLTYHIDHGK